MNPAVDIPTYRGDPILLMLGVALISIGLIAIASAIQNFDNGELP